jgi:hypothetical protein
VRQLLLQRCSDTNEVRHVPFVYNNIWRLLVRKNIRRRRPRCWSHLRLYCYSELWLRLRLVWAARWPQHHVQHQLQPIRTLAPWRAAVAHALCKRRGNAGQWCILASGGSLAQLAAVRITLLHAISALPQAATMTALNSRKWCARLAQKTSTNSTTLRDAGPLYARGSGQLSATARSSLPVLHVGAACVAPLAASTGDNAAASAVKSGWRWFGYQRAPGGKGPKSAVHHALCHLRTSAG